MQWSVAGNDEGRIEFSLKIRCSISSGRSDTEVTRCKLESKAFHELALAIYFSWLDPDVAQLA